MLDPDIGCLQLTLEAGILLPFLTKAPLGMLKHLLKIFYPSRGPLHRMSLCTGFLLSQLGLFVLLPKPPVFVPSGI